MNLGKTINYYFEKGNKPMSEDQFDEDEGSQEESFAELFEAYSSGMGEALQVGDRVKGQIIAIEQATVFLDIGGKVDAVVEREGLLDEKGTFPYAVGDELELYVVAVDESEIRLSRAISGIGGLTLLKEAMAGQIPVEGKVIQAVKGGFQVEVIKHRAFCPISQMDTRYVENPKDYVGNVYLFLVKRLEDRGRNIVISRRELLAREQQAAKAQFFETLTAGQVLEGRVTKLMPYGAFVELIPGVEGMVHISELSWSRLAKPEEAVRPGETLKVKVLKIEDPKKGNDKRIALSAKQVVANPWESVGDRLKSGQRVSGKVTRVAPFGAFVEISPGIEGLVHISEMSYVKRIHKPEEVVQPGETVLVVIKEIDLTQKRISLSLRDAEGDPWAMVAEKYPVGKAFDGVVEKREPFGLFVSLEPGVTGLLPKSKINESGMAAGIDKLKPGQPITVTIVAVDLIQRKISLGTTAAGDTGNWRKFAGQDDTRSLGSLGEMLQKAIQKKDRTR